MTILVTGGKGTTAKPLAEVLKKNNIPFLVASRSSSGQGQVRFDWCDESTYELPFQAATDPITAIYMVAPKVPDVFERMKAFIDFARGKGVKRFVLLSATPVPMGGPMYGKVHEYLTQIGVEYGVVRPTWFMDNLIMDVFNKEIIDKGQISSGAKNGKLPWVSAEDIAAVAYRLLTDEKPHNTDYTVRGPELLTYDQVAEIISKEIGKPVKHNSISDEELYQRFTEMGTSEEEGQILVMLEGQIAQGSEEQMDENVLKVTGRPPKRFATFAAENRHNWL
ncbi:hypothetical protein PV10_03027 [Exophiala mesophila]|uniref:NmrA-like domain-containing protein n=1 Tax=Exophiala mesophila TaxID=212818 RepID=A0A0D1Y3V9_EXOME|nr:uncharacterized protein PV10_03027 [Exophiala mesophila]KIV95361.1 hypothetical protein PV10_03027 [Exophiala mesophila]